MKQDDPENHGGSYGELCVFSEEARFGSSRMRRPTKGTRMSNLLTEGSLNSQNAEV